MAFDEFSVFPPKKTATKVKHRILENCLRAWGGIIITSNYGRPIRLAFVDTCCGSGVYAPDESIESDVYDAGSALIGLDVLQRLQAYGSSRGADVKSKALFINENVDELDTLRAAASDLDSGVSFETLAEPLHSVVAKVSSFCANQFSFVLIDPYGPSAIPFSVVSRLVSRQRADCLINFPYYSIHKWVGWLDSGEQEARLRIVDDLLNGKEWRKIAREHRHNSSSLENLILSAYMDQLGKLGVGVFALRMAFEDRDRTMYHLVFTSHNTAGLAAAKKELQEGEAYQAALRADLKSKRMNQVMFDFMGPDADLVDPVDVQVLANNLLNRFRGKSVSLDDVIRYGLFLPDVLESHVKRALTLLRRSNSVTKSGDKWKDIIKFMS